MFIIWLFIPVIQCQIYDGGKYFDTRDRIRADCVIPGVEYDYLGEQNHDVSGKPCVLWTRVVDEFKENGGIEVGSHDIFELAQHNFCRRGVLLESHPFVTQPDPRNAIATSGKEPWCYVRSTEKWQNLAVTPSGCFPKCQGTPTREKTRRTPYGLHLVDVNYEPMIDNIKGYFKDHNWGDESFYDMKPSEQALSKQYYAVRVQLFFGAIGSLILIIILLIGCYFLKRNATATRKRREKALEEIYNLEDAEPMPQVISRPAPN